MRCIYKFINQDGAISDKPIKIGLPFRWRLDNIQKKIINQTMEV